MKPRLQALIVFAVFLLLTAPAYAGAGPAAPSRLELSADVGWKFLLGDPHGAELASFSDVSWRNVDLPHDWSIEGKPDKDNPTGVGGGYFPAGIGWYRKTFTAPAGWRGKDVTVEFDGVYKNATVYLNGHKLGFHPYGYTSFAFALAPYLNLAGPNLLAVRVDNSSQPNTRWYSGSGIYRHVRVVVTEPTHVAHWGVFITTPVVSAELATVAVQTEVANQSGKSARVTVVTTLYDRSGNSAGTAESKLTVPAEKTLRTPQNIVVTRPDLWSPATPSLYRAISQILVDGKIVDQVETPLGIRSLAWSAAKGLLLNGQPVKLTGGSVHHDNGPLGSAAFDRAEERKVELLKAAGYNAVRTAHNPPSSAFLDACDRIGLLVLDEPFDVWEAHKVKYDYATDFDGWWKQDMSSMVARDRNHPSIVIWGIGNEIPELELAGGIVLAKELANEVRSLDPTRPLTLAFPGSTTAENAKAVFSLLDITGYNYNLLPTYAADHLQLPSRLMLTTESLPSKAYPLWKASQENPFVLGDLTWTAMDYLGESGIGAWAYAAPDQERIASQVFGTVANPEAADKALLGMANGIDPATTLANDVKDPATKAEIALLFPNYPFHASAGGDIDLTGFRKPQSYYRDILWNGGDRVYATVRLPDPEGMKIIAVGWATYPTLPTWSWPGQNGKEMQVDVYSGTDSVRLYLDDKLIGEERSGLEQEFKATFTVPYAPGVLKAVGMRGARTVAQSVLTTAGSAVALRLTADRQVIHGDGQDLSFIEVEAVDSQGRLQLAADQEVTFSIQGPGLIAAVGNGDQRDGMAYQGTSRKLYQGRALVVIRSLRESGKVKLVAQAPGLAESSLSIQTSPQITRPELR